jgi:hypothetical protein
MWSFGDNMVGNSQNLFLSKMTYCVRKTSCHPCLKACIPGFLYARLRAPKGGVFPEKKEEDAAPLT